MNPEEWIIPADEALAAFVPSGLAVFDAVARSCLCDEPLHSNIRAAVLGAWGIAPDRLPSLRAWRGSDTDGLVGRDAQFFDYAQRFAIDVSALTPDDRAWLRNALGGRAGDYLTATYAADMVVRVVAVLERLFAPARRPWMAGPALKTTASVLRELVLRNIHNIEGLDPFTSEVVRLRGAHHHNCRLCKSLRSRSALLASGSGDLLDRVGTAAAAELPPRPAAAVALVDAMVWTPAHVGTEVVAAVRAQFTPAEAIEIVLDVMRNATNKIAVALGTDTAHVEEGTEIYQYHSDGTMTFGLSLSQTD